MSVVHVTKPLAIINPLLFIRESILGEKACECRKTFSQIGHLNLYRRIHTGERSSECKECGNVFRQSAHLAHHQKIHAAESARAPSSSSPPVSPRPVDISAEYFWNSSPFSTQSTFLSPGLFQLCKNWFPCTIFCPFQVHSSHYCHSGL